MALIFEGMEAVSGGESRRRIQEYLRDESARGKRFFKARQIADELRMSPKEVGINMKILQALVSDLRIEAWAHTRCTTWKVEPVSPGAPRLERPE